MLTQQRIGQEKDRLTNQNPNLLNKPSRSESICPDGQHEIHINGIKILFPFEPYECQITYMTKVIDALNQV